MNILSFESARITRQQRELEKIADSYILADELESAIEVFEIILELREAPIQLASASQK